MVGHEPKTGRAVDGFCLHDRRPVLVFDLLPFVFRAGDEESQTAFHREKTRRGRRTF